jgi:hypothetical protein
MTAGCWSRSRRVRSQLAFDPGLKLVQRSERILELTKLGVGAPLVDAAEQAQRLEPVDGRGDKVVAGRRSILAWRSLERIRSARAERAADSPASASA